MKTEETKQIEFSSENAGAAENKKTNKTKEKLKRLYGRISYAIKPFIIFVAVLFVTYFGNQLVYWLMGSNGGGNYPEIPLDSKIPLISWFVYPYYLTFPLGIITFFYLAYANKKSFYALFYTLVISFAISGVIYLFWQTKFTKPDFTPVTFTDRLVVGTWGSTSPINCFPSQHSYMAIAMIIACLTAGKDMKWWYKIFTIAVGIMILLATFFIKQHFFLDWVASLVIMLLAYFAVLIYFHKKKKKHGEQSMPWAQASEKIKGIKEK